MAFTITPDSIDVPRYHYDGGIEVKIPAVLVNSNFIRGNLDNWIATNAASTYIIDNGDGTYHAEFDNNTRGTATLEYKPVCADTIGLSINSLDTLEFNVVASKLFGDATCNLIMTFTGQAGILVERQALSNQMVFQVPVGYDYVVLGFEITGGTTQTKIRVDSIALNVTRGSNVFRENNSIFLNGYSDSVTVDGSGFNQLEGAWEVLASAAWTSMQQGQFTLFNSYAAGANTEFRGWQDGVNLFWVIGGTTNTLISFGAPPTLDWQKVRFSADWEYESVSDQTTINTYTNGNLMDTQIISGKIPMPDQIICGRWHANGFTGIIDDVRLFNRKPDKSIFTEFAFKPFPEFSSNIDFYWKFNSSNFIAENEVSSTYGIGALDSSLVENGFGEAGDNTNFSAFTYVPDASAPGGAAFEVTSNKWTEGSKVAIYDEAFDSANWTMGNASVAVSQLSTPNGSTAYEVMATAAGADNPNLHSASFMSDGESYADAIYMRAGTVDQAQFTYWDNTGAFTVPCTPVVLSGPGIVTAASSAGRCAVTGLSATEWTLVAFHADDAIAVDHHFQLYMVPGIFPNQMSGDSIVVASGLTQPLYIDDFIPLADLTDTDIASVAIEFAPRNLLGADAGPEHVVSKDYYYWTHQPIAEAGLKVGDTVSFGVDCHSETGADKLQAFIVFYDSANNALPSEVGQFITSATYQRSQASGVIPAGCTNITLRGRGDQSGLTENHYFRNAMFNKGGPLPYETTIAPTASIGVQPYDSAKAPIGSPIVFAADFVEPSTYAVKSATVGNPWPTGTVYVRPVFLLNNTSDGSPATTRIAEVTFKKSVV